MEAQIPKTGKLRLCLEAALQRRVCGGVSVEIGATPNDLAVPDGDQHVIIIFDRRAVLELGLDQKL